MSPYQSSLSTPAANGRTAGQIPLSEPVQSTNRLANSNVAETNLTNFPGAPLVTNTPPATDHPTDTVRLKKIVGWCFLFLLLVLLLLMYIAYQTWRATEADKKKKRR
jgi:hypothetical protein